MDKQKFQAVCDDCKNEMIVHAVDLDEAVRILQDQYDWTLTCQKGVLTDLCPPCAERRRKQ